MPVVTIRNLGNKPVEVDSTQPFLHFVQKQHIDWMYACGAKGRCTTCKFVILEGEAALEPLTDAERRYWSKGALRKNERLACQAIFKSDAIVSVPEECQLPHLHYGD
jgi:ferredoxin, 2Fe-2S